MIEPLDFRTIEHFSEKYSDYEATRQNYRTWNLCGMQQHHLKDARVLELGSNDGRMAYAALHYGARSVLGIDKGDGSMYVGRRNVPDAQFIQADVVEFLNEAAPHFDVIMCAGLIYHLEEHAPIFKAMARHLHAGTTKVVICGTAVSLHERTESTLSNAGHRMRWPTVAAMQLLAEENDMIYTLQDYDNEVYPPPAKDYNVNYKLFTLTV